MGNEHFLANNLAYVVMVTVQLHFPLKDGKQNKNQH